MATKKKFTLEQSLTAILTAPQPKGKLSLTDLWAKVLPFLGLLSMLIPSIKKYIDGLIAGIETIIAGGKALPSNLITLWNKIRPYMSILSGLFGKKVAVYINAFIAAIDAITEE